MNSLFDDVPAIPGNFFRSFEEAKEMADMAEDIQGKVLDLVGSEVEKVMATEKGQRMFKNIIVQHDYKR